MKRKLDQSRIQYAHYHERNGLFIECSVPEFLMIKERLAKVRFNI